MERLRTLMKRIATFATLLLALAAAGAWPTGVGEASQAVAPGYIALGDSIDFGIGSKKGEGWVVPFAEALGPDVELHNLAVPGADTKDINLDQLPEALALAGGHRPNVTITLGGGGNDLLNFIQSPEAAACLQVPSCLGRINALLDEAEQRVDLALAALREAAGSEAIILVRTQYNPLRRTGCAPPDRVQLGDLTLEGGAGVLQRGLNDRLRDAAARQGARVIEIFVPFFLLPDKLISADCVHPNDRGYTVILGAALNALP